jgi:hypothetical protein
MAISVLFSCPKCGRVYRASQNLLGRNARQPGRLDCTVCRAMVHSWSGAYDYAIWTPLDIQAPP